MRNDLPLIAEAQLLPLPLAAKLDESVKSFLDSAFQEAQSHEGTLWLVDKQLDQLVPVYNSGPHASRIINGFAQPLSAGLISMVFATEQPFIDNQVEHDPRQSKLLDLTLGVHTRALVATPVYILGQCRGVLSCVKLGEPAQDSAGDSFATASLNIMNRTATLLGRLMEHALDLKLGGQT